jgi:hypothetical protein
MEPNEAVVLLSALGDSNGLLVSQALTADDRTRLIKVCVGVIGMSGKECAVWQSKTAEVS